MAGIPGKARIDLAAAQQAVETGNLRLAKNLYAQRWRQAAPRERDYLIAAAEEYTEHGTITSSAIAARMNAARTQQLAPIRARLLSKGTLVSDGHELHFAVPAWPRSCSRCAKRPPMRARPATASWSV